MDRESLVERNRRMAQVLHQPSTQQRLRDAICRLVALLPVIQQKASAQRLLIIRPDHLGDVLLTTPAIQLIKQKRPDVEIHVLCGPWSAETLSHYQEIDQVLTLAFPGFQRQQSQSGKNPYLQLLQSAKMLREIGYGSAIIMRPDHWWGAMLAHLAGIPERLGYDIDGVAPFLTTRVRPQRQHAVEQNLCLAKAWLNCSEPEAIGLEFPLDSADIAYLDRMLADWRIDGSTRIICIHPGSGAPSKLWENEKWAAVADTLAEQFQAAIVLTGTSDEMSLVDDISCKMKKDALVIAGATSVGQLAALFRRAMLVVGTDNGAMHLAAANQTPTVTLFGPADPAEFAPWGDRRRHAIVTSAIGCRPCRILDWSGDSPELHPCVREISVSQVLKSAREVVETTRTSS